MGKSAMRTALLTASACLFGLPASAAVLENAKTTVEIDGAGNLVRLVNRETGHDWAGGGALWRLYFDSKRGTHEEREIPVAGAEQAVRVETADGAISIVADGVKVRGETLRMKVALKVSLEPSGAVRFSSHVENDEPHTCIRELQYPLVTDCRLPEGAELLTTFLGGERFRDPVGKIAREGNRPPYFGRTWEFRQIDCKYPSHTVANCFAFVTPREGLYLASHDPSFQDTWHLLRTLPSKPLAFTRLETGLGKFPSVQCGERFDNSCNLLYPYSGDWHVTADTYRRWANTWWAKRPAPAWVREMTGWQRIIFRHQYGVTFYTPQDAAGTVWEAGHKAGVDSLLCFGWWNAGMDNGYPDCYFETDPATGGDAAWRQAIRDFRAKGGRFHLYFNGKLIDLESDYFRNGPGKDICYRDNTGAVHTEQYRFKGTGTFTGYFNTRTFTCADHRRPEWRGMLERYVDRAIDFGADSVFLDQMGYCENLSPWTRRGEFMVNDTRIIARKAEQLRHVHDYLDAHAPKDMALGIECFTDCCAQHVDYVHNLIGATRATDFSDWTRYAFPEVVLTDREIRDDTDVEWRVNHNLLLGLRSDAETFRCQRTLDWAPKHQARLAAINRLRRKYPVLMGTYRDTLGFSNSNPQTLLARAFADGDEMAVVVCTAKDVPAKGVLAAPGRRIESWDGIGSPQVEKVAEGVRVDLPANALAVISFGK